MHVSKHHLMTRPLTLLLIAVWHPVIHAQMTCGELNLAYESACASACDGNHDAVVFSNSSGLTCAHAKSVYQASNCCLSNSTSLPLSTSVAGVWGPFVCSTSGNSSNASTWCDTSNPGVLYVPTSERDNLGTTVNWSPVLVQFPSASALYALFLTDHWFSGVNAFGLTSTVRTFMWNGLYPFMIVDDYFQYFCFQAAFSTTCEGQQFVCRGFTVQNYDDAPGWDSDDKLNITYGSAVCYNPDTGTVRGSSIAWSDFVDESPDTRPHLYGGVYMRFPSSNKPKYWVGPSTTYTATSAPPPAVPPSPLSPPRPPHTPPTSSSVALRTCDDNAPFYDWASFNNTCEGHLQNALELLNLNLTQFCLYAENGQNCQTTCGPVLSTCLPECGSDSTEYTSDFNTTASCAVQLQNAIVALNFDTDAFCANSNNTDKCPLTCGTNAGTCLPSCAPDSAEYEYNDYTGDCASFLSSTTQYLISMGSVENAAFYSFCNDLTHVSNCQTTCAPLTRTCYP